MRDWPSDKEHGMLTSEWRELPCADEARTKILDAFGGDPRFAHPPQDDLKASTELLVDQPTAHWTDLEQIYTGSGFDFYVIDKSHLSYFLPGLLLAMLKSGPTHLEWDALRKLARQVAAGEVPGAWELTSDEQEAIRSFRRCTRCQYLVWYYS
jgi:hypothetical protein